MSRFAAALVGIASVVLASGVASAAVVYSGPLNLSVPGTFDGLYVNVVTGLATPTTTGNTNYDFNPYIPTPGTSTSWTFFSPDGATGGTVVTGTATAGTAAVLAQGDIIDGTDTFRTSGAPAPAFNGVANALVGFRFTVETTPATVHFGWARVTLPTPGTVNPQAPGTLIDYAYESTPLTAIAAGVVPEPTTLAALGLGGLLLRRRRA